MMFVLWRILSCLSLAVGRLFLVFLLLLLLLLISLQTRHQLSSSWPLPEITN